MQVTELTQAWLQWHFRPQTNVIPLLLRLARASQYQRHPAKIIKWNNQATMDSAVTWSTLPYQVNKHRDVRCQFTVLSSERQSQGPNGWRGHMTGAFRPRSNTHGFIALGPYLLVKFAVTRTHTNEFKTSCASRALHYFSSPQAKMPLQIGLKQVMPPWHITKACCQLKHCSHGQANKSVHGNTKTMHPARLTSRQHSIKQVAAQWR